MNQKPGWAIEVCSLCIFVRSMFYQIVYEITRSMKTEFLCYCSKIEMSKSSSRTQFSVP